MRRRHVLSGLALSGLALSGLALAPVGAHASLLRRTRHKPLQQEAGRARMLFGAAVQARQIVTDRPFREAVVAHCGSITPEIELKWDFIEADRGRPQFLAADQLARFAQTHGKRFHGHAILWHKGIPPWAVQQMADAPDWSLVASFLRLVMTRYAAQIAEWDVINEPFDPDGPHGGLRVSPFLTAYGKDYIRRAFEEARQIVPGRTLFLNEYGLIYHRPDSQKKREALLRVLDALAKAGAAPDGIGIQGHLELAQMPDFDEQIFADFMNELGARGLQVRISELDVLEANTALPVEERDRLCAEAVERFVGTAIENRAVGSICCWGLSDRYSWLPPQSEQSGFNRGLPLDSDLRSKPFFSAMLRAFQERELAQNKANPALTR